MRAGFDSNVLVYAEGLNGRDQQNDVLEIMQRIPREDQTIPAQALGELYHVLTRKGGLTRSVALDRVDWWMAPRSVSPTTHDVLRTALLIASEHQIQIWDSIILASAEAAGCRLLLSEDMHNGFTWGGITVVNPFAEDRHWLLEAALGNTH